MNVIEIFKSIEGEGKRQGELCTFIRLAGCNMRCPYCDTKYSYDNSEVKTMTLDTVIDKIIKSQVKNITITGGEPLLQAKEIISLVNCLPDFEFNIETNGTIARPFSKRNLFYTVDYKMPSSKSKIGINLNWLHQFTKKDVIKFVVSNKDELDMMRDFIKLNADKIPKHIYVSPVFNDIEPADIVEYLKERNLIQVKLQLQIHKFIWNSDARGV